MISQRQRIEIESRMRFNELMFDKEMTNYQKALDAGFPEQAGMAMQAANGYHRRLINLEKELHK